ncbi:MAG TPA: polysaccharide biosynthesis protein, partial [Rhodothermales bacterium]|nr:polysaccharide biosynthesis protein [Rhodothermales bacterium]
TVTDPDMIRYFMTIPEAAQLVLQAGAMGLNGRVCVLDMGEPVRIVDLARDLILLSGLEPGTDVAIEFSGQRQGEKLYEELLTAEEGIEASRHEKIYVAKTAPLYGNLIRQLERLFAAAATHDGRAVRTVLQQFVPLYSPDPAALAPAMGSGEGVHGLTGSGDGSSGDGSVRLEEPTLVVSKGARAPA